MRFLAVEAEEVGDDRDVDRRAWAVGGQQQLGRVGGLLEEHRGLAEGAVTGRGAVVVEGGEVEAEVVRRGHHVRLGVLRVDEDRLGVGLGLVDDEVLRDRHAERGPGSQPVVGGVERGAAVVVEHLEEQPGQGAVVDGRVPVEVRRRPARVGLAQGVEADGVAELDDALDGEGGIRLVDADRRRQAARKGDDVRVEPDRRGAGLAPP